MSEFNVQNFANTAWAFATVKRSDEKLFPVLALEAERRLGEFGMQNFVNIV